MPKGTFSAAHLTDISELSAQVDWDDFSLPAPERELTKDDFSLIAIGKPNREKEKWDMEIVDVRYSKREDLIYVMVIGGKILKIGKSITTMKNRVDSYHCGKDSYRVKKNATNSATNWFILQSVLAINLPVYIYALYIPQTEGKFFGWTYPNRVSKEVEGKIITAFIKKYGFKPIGNKQN